MQTVIAGSSQHKPTPALQEADSPQVAALPADNLVFLVVGSAGNTDTDLIAQIARLAPDVKSTKLSPITPEALPALDWVDIDGGPNSQRSASTVGDPTEGAIMFGRYTDQITARVERAWVRPDTAVGEDPARSAQTTAEDRETFRCRVQIRQDTDGYVQEVLLLACNGTEAWRRSLVTAINQASPLPAPPTPSVFVRALTMNFEAHEERPGSGQERYELNGREDLRSAR